MINDYSNVQLRTIITTSTTIILLQRCSHTLLLCELQVVCFNINQLFDRGLAETIPSLCMNKSERREITLRFGGQSHQTQDLPCQDMKSWPSVAMGHPEHENTYLFLQEHAKHQTDTSSHLQSCNPEIGVFKHHCLLRFGCRRSQSRMTVYHMLDFDLLIWGHVHTQVTRVLARRQCHVHLHT